MEAAKSKSESKNVARSEEPTKRGLLATLGPGLITGAADDDPSGIATYSQVGAAYGFHMLWVMLFTYPLMVGIQEISGKIGRASGRGIAGNLRKFYPAWIMHILIFSMLIANVINIGADIGAMGAATSLMIKGSPLLFAAILAVISLVLQIFAPYDRYTLVLKWMCLALFAYIITAFVVHVHWVTALRSTAIPYFNLKTDFIVSIVAVLGTTISPYLFFWQAAEEVEIQKAVPEEKPLRLAPQQADKQLHRIRVDTLTGMAFSNIVSWFIILVAATTLNAHHVTDIQTATQAATALKPLAGRLAYAIFAIGIIGTGLLAVPVLAGSAAYAVGEAFKWPVGLAKDPMRAKRFYAVLALSMLVGLGMCFAHVSPIKALFWSAVINGVVAGPIMVLMMIMGCNKKVMGEFTLTKRQLFLGWLATAVMTVCTVIMFATWGKS